MSARSVPDRGAPSLRSAREPLAVNETLAVSESLVDGGPSGEGGAKSAYAAAVNQLVRQIPAGRAMTYGLIAEILRERMGMGGPRVVGNVLSGAGSRYAALIDGVGPGAAVIGPVQDNFDLPWWRVVNVAGAPPPHYHSAAIAALIREGTPLKQGGDRVDLRRAVWFPGWEAEMDDGRHGNRENRQIPGGGPNVP